ncbi:MAG: sugar transferase [Cyanobacteria bacterium REEB459]|nr:sugar transferase [Cyanobacteria bacterium REEB459]
MLSSRNNQCFNSSEQVIPSMADNHPSVHSSFKRITDIAGSLVGLSILAIILVPVAALIKLDSPGPIFYSQVRYGLKGKPFRIRKFRSMVVNADALKASVPNQAQGIIFKNESDPRVTRIGKLLRKTSLDEFPQFFNVLKGEMSLVGTRPPTGDEVARYSEYHWRRLDVKPGLTGQWQVSGRSAVKDFEEIVKLDLSYQRLWSPWHDIKIIARTFLVIFDNKGAY